MLEEINHAGSVTYSVTVPNPAPGEGKHAKTLVQALSRHIRYQYSRAFKLDISKLDIRREK